MKFCALVFVCVAVLVDPAWAAPTLRLGDMVLEKRATDFTLSDLQTQYSPLILHDEEAFLLLVLAEAGSPLAPARLRATLAREGVRIDDPLGAVVELNARAERRLNRVLIAHDGETYALDMRPRVVPGIAFRPVENGVIHQERWVDLTSAQADFLATVAAGESLSFADLARAGWTPRQARRLVARINRNVGERLLEHRLREGVRLSCARDLFQGR